MLKNVTMNANFPSATTRQRYCGPEENQCVSHVAQHDPKDYHFEANMKIQYAYRDCVKANATQIYHTLYYKRYHFLHIFKDILKLRDLKYWIKYF